LRHIGPLENIWEKFAQALMYSYRYTNDQSYIEQTQKIIDTWIEAQQPDGNTLTGKTGEYLDINRTWSGIEHIIISMKVMDQVIEGSPTYKGYYAFKHGPYVLALDQQLTPDIDQIKINNTLKMKLKPVNRLLPHNWVGNQAFLIESKDSRPLILTPFLDAGQEGSKYRVWISAGK
jgi:hypothetical protein